MKNKIDKLIEMCRNTRKYTMIDIDEDVLYDFEDLLNQVELEQRGKLIQKHQLLSLAQEASYLYEEFDDMSNLIFDVIYNSLSYPTIEIWRLHPFSEIMGQMKLTMYDLENEFSLVPFSFGKFNMSDINDAITVLDFVDYYDEYDIDNVLTILDMEKYQLDYPVNFEKIFLESIEKSSWGSNNCYGVGYFDTFCEKNKFFELEEYFHS